MDGRFQGVVTTGIYCRPGCSGRPHEDNVRRYAFAAAAEAEGFRPCLRCRPDREPRWPDWLGPSELVCRALQLIGRGALDGAGVDDLAARLGVGPRHLRRLFEQHVGASPLALARSRRAHFARHLLDETDLTISDVAFASGFTSVRQFNRTMLEIFRFPPTRLRERRRRRGDGAGATGGLRVQLAYRPPLDWGAMTRYLAARAVPGVEAVDERSYRRTIEWDGTGGVLELTPDPGRSHLVLTVELSQLGGLIHVVEQARRIFDLGADPAAIAGALGHDPTLARLVADRPGMRVPGAWDPYEVGVRAVLGQQISVAAATARAGRLANLGEPIETGDGALARLFPPPEVLAGADLGGLGLPAPRAEAVRAFAAAVASGDLVLDGSRGLAPLAARLQEIRGIGPWTAQYIAMRACGEPDAFPAEDLGLRRAAGNGAGPVAPAELEARAEAWRPWRAYAAMHLWMSGSGETTTPPRVTTPV